jgi:tryptophan synthase beta subunit
MMEQQGNIIVNLSGRGDKDLDTVIQVLELTEDSQ